MKIIVYLQITYVLTPESVIDSRGVNCQKAERYAAQVVRQPAVVKIFRVTAECVIACRHGHANLQYDITHFVTNLNFIALYSGKYKPGSKLQSRGWLRCLAMLKCHCCWLAEGFHLRWSKRNRSIRASGSKRSASHLSTRTDCNKTKQ